MHLCVPVPAMPWPPTFRASPSEGVDRYESIRNDLEARGMAPRRARSWQVYAMIHDAAVCSNDDNLDCAVDPKLWDVVQCSYRQAAAAAQQVYKRSCSEDRESAIRILTRYKIPVPYE